MNVAEDLSGLSRAELVYKAKLAEQAERCVRAASRFHFGFSTVCASRRGRRTAKNLSGAPGSGRSRIGSGFGGTERATADARDDPRGVREPVSGGASDRAARAPRRPGSRARSRGFFAHRRIVNSNRDTSSSAAPGHELGGLPRGWRARPPRGCGEQPRPAASTAAARLRLPRGASTPRGDAPSDPLDWARRAHQSTRVVRRRTVWCRLRRSGAFFSFFFFLFWVRVNRRRRSY
jgi:hypothetical protein